LDEYVGAARQHRIKNMMEPKFERARVLGEALDIATNALEDPIDKVQVSREKIFVFAGRERLELSYTYDNAYAQDGSVMPGSGHWSVSIVKLTRKKWFTP
jgi:hypothetical protein